MSGFNFLEAVDSQDEHFMQNLGGENDIFQQYCKIKTHSDQVLIKKKDKSQMEDQAPFTIIKSQAQGKEKGSSNEKKKIYYRDKMVSLLKPGEHLKQESSNVSCTPNQQSKAPNTKQEQLKRNRESAKNSRQRKKEYISFLEKKNQEQAKMITELTQKLQKVTLERDRLREDNHAEFKKFCINKAKAFQELQQALKEQKYVESNMDYILNEIMAKFGASGSERVKLINYYMNEIIEDLVTDVHKYFLVSSSLLPNFMPSSKLKRIDEEVMRILRLDSTKLSSILTKFKHRFVKQTTVFKDLTQELYRIFKSIQSQGKVIELVFVDLKKQIEPKKALAQMIIWFQQNRFCREVKRVRDQWVQQLKTGQEVIQVFRKQIKQEAN